MAKGDRTQGRRREDTPFRDLPEDVQPGDYWKCLKEPGGDPVESTSPGNLTGTVWMFMAPAKGGIGTLTKHTVREHEDGTASIVPGDGSSNSVLIAGGGGQWHGYLYRGVWEEV